MGVQCHADPNDQDANWSYCPSLTAAILFCTFFSITSAVHLAQAVIYKKPYMWVLIMGALWETAGYAFRTWSVLNQIADAPNIAQSLFILLGPLWINASAYMTLGRMIYVYLGPDPVNQRVFGVRATKLTLLFVGLDITAFIIQGIGGSLASGNPPEHTEKLGFHVYTGGVGFQQLAIILFTVLAYRFQVRLREVNHGSDPARSPIAARSLLYALYTALALISARIIYRLVEFLSSTDGPIQHHEWFQYVFDAVPMLFALIVFHVAHPGKYLRGPGSSFPSRKEKKAAKQTKKAERRAEKDAKMTRGLEEKAAKRAGIGMTQSQKYGSESSGGSGRSLVGRSFGKRNSNETVGHSPFQFVARMYSLRGFVEKGQKALSHLAKEPRNTTSQSHSSQQDDTNISRNTAQFAPYTDPLFTQSSTPSHYSSPTGRPLSFTIEVLGKSVLKPGFIEIGRDGGGGGCVNGKHIVLFSDTMVRGWGPINNTICYASPSNPVQLEDFGKNGVPVQGVPYLDEEKEYTDKGGGKTRVVIWPQSTIVPLPHDPTRGIGVAPVSIQSAPGAPQPSRELYNSLYTITAGDVPKVERTVPKLWHDGSVFYGTFSTFHNPHDGMLYFFAAEGNFHTQNTGLKVARASLDSYTDKSKWSFWTGSSWTSTPPKPHEAKPIMPNVYSSGDIFYSPFFKTYLAVYFLGIADSTFRYRYALPDRDGKASLTGKWSEDYVLYDSSAVKNGGYGFNYAGHAYPHYDPSGETLVLSCTSSDGMTPWFFKVRFRR